MLLSGYLFPPEHLGLPSIPIPLEWFFVMSELPIATIGCVGRALMTKQCWRCVTPHYPGERSIYTEDRSPENLNMAKVTKKSWKPQTTSIQRWKKKKTHSHPGSRHNRKVSWPYPRSSSSSPSKSYICHPPQIILPLLGTNLLLSSPSPCSPIFFFQHNVLWADLVALPGSEDMQGDKKTTSCDLKKKMLS